MEKANLLTRSTYHNIIRIIVNTGKIIMQATQMFLYK